MTTDQFASHRIDERSIDRCLQDLRDRITSLNLAEVEAQIGFTLAETIAFYEADLAQVYPLTFGDDWREFLIQLAEQMVHSKVGAFLLTAQGCDWRTTDLFFDTAHRTAIQQQLQQKQLPLKLQHCSEKWIR